MPELAVKPLPFSEAIEIFREKGYAFSPGSWRDVWQEAHARAFTVARVTAMDVLADIRGELDRAISRGTTLREFKKNLVPTLRRKGWFARTAEEIEAEGVKRLTPWRLDTIFHTNVQSAYQTGRYRQMMDVVEQRPYWMYDAVLDGATRPPHRAMDGKVYHYRHPIWKRWYPPNGFR